MKNFPIHVNPLQLLNALSAEGTSKGLSYAKVEMNENGVEAMLDSGVTHNFVVDRMAQQLGLKVSKCKNCFWVCTLRLAIGQEK